MESINFGGSAVIDKPPSRKKIVPREGNIEKASPAVRHRIEKKVDKLIREVESLPVPKNKSGALDLKKQQEVAEQLASLEEQEKELDAKMAAADAGVTNAEIGERYLKKNPISPFGRQPERTEKQPYDPEIAKQQAYERLVGDSGAKKSRREYNPVDDIVKRLDELTKSEDVRDHQQAAEILKKMTPEQTEQLPEKMPPELINRLMEIEAPGFGRRPEKAKNPVHDPDREDAEAYDKLVHDSSKKQALRGFTAPAVNAEKEPAAKKTGGTGREYISKSITGNPDNLSREELDKIRVNGPSKVEAFRKQQEKRLNSSVEKNKLESFHKKFKNIIGDHPLASQLLVGGVSAAASVLGFKSIYDVPTYFKQRYDVRGNVFGFGHGKGLSGSVEELIGANQAAKKNRHNEKGAAEKKGEKEGTEKSAVSKAIDDLNKRLVKTKEGSTKGSEQRKMLAELLRSNRHEKMQSAETRRKELENILDNYTNTKVSGIQATREALNTACMASGAVALRGVVYGGLAFFEKREEMRRKAEGEARKKGPEAKAEHIGLEKVFWQGLKETYQGLTMQTGRNKKEKGLAFAKSAGSVARFVGIAFGMSTGGHAYHADLDKIINAFEGKLNFSDIGHNFIDNAERYWQRITNLPGTVSHLAHSLPHLPGAVHADPIHPDNSNFAPSSVIHHPAAAAQSGKLASMTQPEEIPATSAITEIHYQGGKSVWNELRHQLSARFGKDFDGLSKQSQEESIKLLENKITGNPEAFGLPRDTDFTKLSKDQLEKIPWNNFFGNEPTPTEVVHDLHQTLTDNSSEHVVRFGGGNPEEAGANETEDLDQEYANSANFFASRGVHEKLAELAEKAKQLDGHLDPTKRNLIFNEISDARETVRRVTGGLLVYESGDWSVKMPNGESINVFHGHGTGAEELAGSGEVQPEQPIEQGVGAAMRQPIQPLAFHRPSLGLGHQETGSVPEHPAAGIASHQEVAGKTPEDTFSKAVASAKAEQPAPLDIKDSREITGAFNNAEVARQLAEKSGTVDLRNVNSISHEAFEAMRGKTNLYVLTGLEANMMDDAAYRDLAQLKENCTVLTNDLVEKGFRHWQDAHGGNLWAVNEQHVPAPEQAAPLAGNILNDAETARHLAENPGMVDLKNVSSISKEALEALSNKSSGLVVLTGLKPENMSDEICRSIAHLKENCTVEMDQAADQRFNAWQNAHNENLWAVDKEHMPTPGQAAAPENIAAVSHEAAADFAAQVQENPLGVFHEVKPDFADQFSPAQRETLTAFLNEKIQEHNKMLQALREYQDKYGDRPGFPGFRRSLEEQIKSQDDMIGTSLKNFANPEAKIDEFKYVLGQPMEEPQTAVDARVANFALQNKLVDAAEMSGSGYNALENRVATHGAAKVITAEDVNRISPSAPEAGKPEISHEHVVAAGDGKQAEVFASGEIVGATGQENLNMDVVNKLHLSPSQLEALKAESNNLTLLGNQLLKNGPDSPENGPIIETIKAIIKSGNDKLNPGGSENIFSQSVLNVGALDVAHHAAGAAEAVAPAAEQAAAQLSPDRVIEIKNEVGGLYDKFRYADWTKLVDGSAVGKFDGHPAAESIVENNVSLIQRGLAELKGTDDPQQLAAIQRSMRELIETTENKYGATLGVRKIFSEPIRKLVGLS
jgi:hypothetical protein